MRELVENSYTLSLNILCIIQDLFLFFRDWPQKIRYTKPTQPQPLEFCDRINHKNLNFSVDCPVKLTYCGDLTGALETAMLERLSLPPVLKVSLLNMALHLL